MAQPDPIADALERASADLDRLIQARRLGPRNHHQHDRDEEAAKAIAAAIVAPFRGVPGGGTVRTAPGKNGGVWAW